jgi:enoyl-[acyl-carrier-protein] reductase (NADH)
MSRRAQENPDLLHFMKTKQPVTGGIMEPEQIARAAWFLLTCEAITGEVLHVDGGWRVA